MVDPAPGKRPRKIDPHAKREAILGAALESFALRGYDATTIAVVAADSNVAVGSVHRIFGDKLGLLSEAKRELETGFVSVLDAAWRQEGPLEWRFRTMFEALFTEMDKRRHLMPVMLLNPEANYNGKSTRSSALQDAIEKHMQDAILKGEFRDILVRESSAIAVGMVDAAIQTSFGSNDPEAKQRSISVLVEMMLRYVKL
jgi:AcrR family transcriptional regulator